MERRSFGYSTFGSFVDFNSKVWLVRRSTEDGYAFGYVFDLVQHKVIFSNDRRDLGWEQIGTDSVGAVSSG